VAVSVLALGPSATRWASERLRHDERNSADGALTEAAIMFAGSLLSGELPVARSAAWVRTRLCSDATASRE
jgi:hypothetical protein